jgi:hypothetical protein
VRKQYHFRDGPDGLRAWDVHRLVELARDLPIVQIPLSDIPELDEPYWYGRGVVPTCRSVAEHAKLINETDLRFPLILSSDGRIMDGMHRAARAVVENINSLPAKRFTQDPEPDYVGVGPDELPY